MTMNQASQAGNDFAWDLYHQLRVQQGNLFFSPSSIDLALVMTWTGARGATAREMGSVLHLGKNGAGDPALVGSAYGELLGELGSPDGNYTLRVTNRLWGQKGYRFRDSFLDPLARDFGAGLQELDFVADTDGSRRIINAWVEEQTEEKIKDLLAPGSLDRDVRLVLTNAVYFLGDWQYQFKGANTADRTFHVGGSEETRVPTMHQTHRFAYAEDDQVQVLSLPYVGQELEMVIVLPRERTGLAAVEKNLDAARFDAWTRELTERNVKLWLPKFTLAGEFSLARVLGEMGMASAFGSQADFSGMAEGPGLFISDVVHKSFVDVFEKGTEAAAATGVTMSLTSMPFEDPETVVFNADHPFLFLIRQVETGNILFLGRLIDPHN